MRRLQLYLGGGSLKLMHRADAIKKKKIVDRGGLACLHSQNLVSFLISMLPQELPRVTTSSQLTKYLKRFKQSVVFGCTELQAKCLQTAKW